jgi:hypothetical protein
MRRRILGPLLAAAAASTTLRLEADPPSPSEVGTG